jgi:hypothetical protein
VVVSSETSATRARSAVGSSGTSEILVIKASEGLSAT